MESLHIAHSFGRPYLKLPLCFRKIEIYTTLRVIGFGVASTFLGGA